MSRRAIPADVKATFLRRLSVVGVGKLRQVAKECGVARSTAQAWWDEHEKSVSAAAPPPVPAVPRPPAPHAGGLKTPPVPGAGAAAAAAKEEAARQGVPVSSSPATAPAAAPAVPPSSGAQLLALAESIPTLAARGCAIALGVEWTPALEAKCAFTKAEKDSLSATADSAAVVLLPFIRDFNKVCALMFLGNLFLMLMTKVYEVRKLAPKKPAKTEPKKVVDQEPPPASEEAPPASSPQPTVSPVPGFTVPPQGKLRDAVA